LGEKLVEKNTHSSLNLSITEHKAYVLDRSDILDIGNKNIVLYRIEFMMAIHRPSTYWNQQCIFVRIFMHKFWNPIKVG
jgi:hypothetical protein